jgi:hypothetical protein
MGIFRRGDKDWKVGWGPWFIATEQFGPWTGASWTSYLSWSGLNQLEKVVSLDPMLFVER